MLFLCVIWIVRTWGHCHWLWLSCLWIFLSPRQWQIGIEKTISMLLNWDGFIFFRGKKHAFPIALCLVYSWSWNQEAHLPDTLASRIAVQTCQQKVFAWSVTGWREVKPLLSLWQLASADCKCKVLCGFRQSSNHSPMIWAAEILAVVSYNFWLLRHSSATNSL